MSHPYLMILIEFQCKNHRMSNQFDDDVDSLMKMKMRINLVQFKSDQNIEIPESFPDISTSFNLCHLLLA